MSTNMYSDVYYRVRTGVLHFTFFKNGTKLSSGSGFLLNGLTVTNNHVYHAPGADEVVIVSASTERCRLKYQDFQSCLVTGSTEENHDYAILKLPVDPKQLHNFDFERTIKPTIGREYAVLGYPFEHNNLTLHRGIISSIYDRKGVEIFQLDASVNNGNSGGPLIELTSGNVVGIVTRKHTGLTDMFGELQKALDGNIQVIEKAMKVGTISFGGFDPNKALLSGQHQMKILCREIERSANTGIGYAFSISPVISSGAY